LKAYRWKAKGVVGERLSHTPRPDNEVDRKPLPTTLTNEHGPRCDRGCTRRLCVRRLGAVDFSISDVRAVLTGRSLAAITYDETPQPKKRDRSREATAAVAAL